MGRVIAVALAMATMIPVSPLIAMGQAGASISGTARTTAGRAVANTSVRLRNVTTNQVVGMTTTNTAGEFRFSGLMPATYAVEVVNAAGQIIGTSSAINLTAGAAIAGISVTAAAVTGTAAAAGLSTAAIVGIIGGAGAALAAVVVVKAKSSPSQ